MSRGIEPYQPSPYMPLCKLQMGRPAAQLFPSGASMLWPAVTSFANG
jgi:hypothetical protein